jgi:L-2-hydroxyglutarate oxidase LhgO
MNSNKNNPIITTDIVVIGAGVIGLATARAFALAGHEVIVLEAETTIGNHTSSRNSEVIHAGIYYPPDSLKAKLCVAGKDQLYSYCQSRQVPVKRCGKLIVAANQEQINKLNSIKENAERNGVTDLQILHKSELQRLEPELKAEAALLSPSTGIIDSHSLMLALQADIERHQGIICCNSRVISGQVKNKQNTPFHYLEILGDEHFHLHARTVINSTGLNAVRILHKVEGFPVNQIPKLIFAKGNYFSLSSKPPFQHLIYPIPEDGGLGIHLTLDLAGQAKFGPDVEWLSNTQLNDPNSSMQLDKLDYRVDSERAMQFYKAIRHYWPNLPDNSLTANYSGIRPKLMSEYMTTEDFIIAGESQHGINNWINLIGIESPGLTSCLAIADAVVTLANQESNTL